MGWFGWWSSSNTKNTPSSPSAAMLQLEQQIEMMDIVFRQSVSKCSKKCIPQTYRDGELNKGESVCIKRCVSKYIDSHQIVGTQLAEMGSQAQQSGTVIR